MFVKVIEYHSGETRYVNSDHVVEIVIEKTFTNDEDSCKYIRDKKGNVVKAVHLIIDDAYEERIAVRGELDDIAHDFNFIGLE